MSKARVPLLSEAALVATLESNENLLRTAAKVLGKRKEAANGIFIDDKNAKRLTTAISAITDVSEEKGIEAFVTVLKEIDLPICERFMQKLFDSKAKSPYHYNHDQDDYLEGMQEKWSTTKVSGDTWCQYFGTPTAIIKHQATADKLGLAQSNYRSDPQFPNIVQICFHTLGSPPMPTDSVDESM